MHGLRVGEEAGGSSFTSDVLDALYPLWFCFVPFRSLSWRDFHIRSVFQKIDADTSERIDTPLRISVISEIVCKEGFEVLRERASHDGIACAAHDPRLENKVMLRQCYIERLAIQMRRNVCLMKICTMCSGGLYSDDVMKHSSCGPI